MKQIQYRFYYVYDYEQLFSQRTNQPKKKYIYILMELLAKSKIDIFNQSLDIDELNNNYYYFECSITKQSNEVIYIQMQTSSINTRTKLC